MAPEVHIVRATAAHADELAAAIRPAAAAEVLASGGFTPREAALASIAWSERRGGMARAAYVGDRLAGLFGVGRRSLLASTAWPWLLTTDVVERYPGTFTRWAKAYLDFFLGQYDALEQRVDARRPDALRWAEHLGFEVEPAVPFGRSGLPFHRILLARRS